MTRLLLAETIKLRTTRTAIGFAIAALLLVLALVIVQLAVGDIETREDKLNVITGASGAITLIIVFGVVGAAGEHRWGTITPSLLVAPDRVRVIVAKMLAYGLTGVLVGLLLTAVTYVIAIPFLGGEPGPDLSTSDYVKVAVGGCLVAGIAAMLGVAIGALVRSQVAAVVGTLVYFFVLDPLVQVIDEDLYPYTISSAGSALSGVESELALSQVSAGLVLLAWALGICALAVLVDRRRDVA